MADSWFRHKTGFQIKTHDNGDGTFSVYTHDLSGGQGVSDQGLEWEGFRIELHDNGDGTFSPFTTTTTGAADVQAEHEGFRLKLHPTGNNDPSTGEPMYAIVVNAI